MTTVFNEDLKDRAARDLGKVDVASLDQYTPVTGKLPVMSQDYLYAITEGDITGHTLLRKLGRQPAVSTTKVDLWGQVSTITLPASAMQMSVKSSDNTQDKAGGTGALTVAIDYLDGDYAEQTTTVTLNGTTWVDTTPTNMLRIQSFHVTTAGSGGVPVGNITIADKATRAIVYDQISIGYNRSFMAAWTVPAGKTYYISNWKCGAASGASKSAEFCLASQSHDGVATSLWYTHDIMILQDGTATVHLDGPIKVPATATVKICVIGSGTVSCTGSFVGWYE